MRRKVLRDLTGMTGIKLYLAVLLMQAGHYKYQLNGKLERAPAQRWWAYPRNLLHNAWGLLVTHAALFAGASLLGAPWLFALWWVALLTSFQLILRLRQIGDHGMVPNRADPDPIRHTRTTDARWWERILIVPHNVNYHLEHHLMPAAPMQSLPRIRALLDDQGLLTDAAWAPSFMTMLKGAVRERS